MTTAVDKKERAPTEGKPAVATPANMPVGAPGETRHPLMSLREEVNRLFDDVFAGFTMMPFGGRSPMAAWPWLEPVAETELPGVDIAETDKEYRLSAEMPGVEEKDLDVSVADDVLTIKGEKRQASEQKADDYVLSERRYGTFARSFTLPAEADTGKITASFKNGVLTVAVPKRPDAPAKRRRIELMAA